MRDIFLDTAYRVLRFIMNEIALESYKFCWLNASNHQFIEVTNQCIQWGISVAFSFVYLWMNHNFLWMQNRNCSGFWWSFFMELEYVFSRHLDIRNNPKRTAILYHVNRSIVTNYQTHAHAHTYEFSFTTKWLIFISELFLQTNKSEYPSYWRQ